MDPRGIRIQITTKNGASGSFSLNQAYREHGGKVAVHLESIVAPGRAKAFFANNLLPQVDRIVATGIDLKASRAGGLEGGVFAWARYGFVPIQEDWDQMRMSGLNKLRDGESGIDDKGLRDQVGHFLMAADPVELRRLVLLSWTSPPKSGVKELLNKILSSNAGWDGVLDLRDEDSREWIETYVTSTPDGFNDLLARFAELLPPDAGEHRAPEGYVVHQPASKVCPCILF